MEHIEIFNKTMTPKKDSRTTIIMQKQKPTPINLFTTFHKHQILIRKSNILYIIFTSIAIK